MDILFKIDHDYIDALYMKRSLFIIKSQTLGQSNL
jgi:hypothetical protein